VAFPEEVPSDNDDADDDGVGLGDSSAAGGFRSATNDDLSETVKQGARAAPLPPPPASAPPPAAEVCTAKSGVGVGGGTSAALLSVRCCRGPGPRVAERRSCADEAAARGPLRDPASAEAWEALASKRWQPVSRRRVLSKGWHLDVGPGEFFIFFRQQRQ